MKNAKNKFITVAVVSLCLSSLIIQFFFKNLLAVINTSCYFYFVWPFFHSNVFHLAANLYAFYLMQKFTKSLLSKVILSYFTAIGCGFFCMYTPTVGLSGMLYSITGMQIALYTNRNTLAYRKRKMDALIRVIFFSLTSCLVPLLVDLFIIVLHQKPFFWYRINSLLHLSCLITGFVAYHVYITSYIAYSQIKNECNFFK